MPSTIAPSITTAGAIMAQRSHLAEEASWSIKSLVGRFVALEPSKGGGDASLSLIACLIREVQANEGYAAWISLNGVSFFPPDFADCGVDLAALPIVRTPDLDRAARAAATLIRSGSFALVVVDANLQHLPLTRQNRLSGLAHHFHTALVSVRGNNDAFSRGSLVSLRCTAQNRRTGHDCFAYELRAVKDKRMAAGWTHREYRSGPDGLS
jgi:recombination protein RecA